MTGSADICKSCGLCCDGTLFGQVGLQPAEHELAAGCGASILRRNDGAFFQQPCPMHKNGLCTVYDTRFKVCRTFRCRLLSKLKAGEISAVLALATVQEAKRLREKAVRSAGVADFPVLRAFWQKWFHSWTPDERRENAAMILNYLACSHYLRRHFYTRAPEDTMGTTTSVVLGSTPSRANG